MTCHVTVIVATATGRRAYRPERCDQPAVAHGLCADHLADRVRLGGARGD